MIILAALFIFLVFKGLAAIGRQLPRAASRRGRHRVLTRPAGAKIAPLGVDQHVESWTALDDVQLTRLLKDSAPQ